MTFCAVMTGVVLTNWGMPLWLGVLASIATGAFCGAVSGFLIAKLKIPPFIATLGMMWAVKGLSLVVTDARPIYFNDTPNFDMISQASLIGYFVPSVPIPNGVLILFVLAVICLHHPQSHGARALHLRARQQRGGGAAVGRQRRRVENRSL